MNAVPQHELIDTLLALTAITLASLFGSISFAFGKRLQRILPYLLAIASGILISTAVTHLLPESIVHLASVHRAMALFLAGLLGSFLLERLLSMRLHPGKPLAASILMSGAVHSFVDGVAIAVAFAVNHETGIATTLAVLLHEVPHHVADVGVLIYSGMSRGRATLLNLAATAGCAAGGLLVLLSGFKSAAFTFTVLPIVAANFLYIGLAILLPELHREKNSRRSAIQAVSFVVAAVAMAALSYWGPL